jgi:putative redox protein
MDAKATLKEQMTFIATADTGFEIRLDANKKVGGEESGFEALELMAMSLAGCAGMDVISILRKKQQVVTAFEVRVHAEQARDYPRVFTALALEYVVSGHGIEEVALRRAIELSATKYCPALAMLGRVVPIDIRYQILEAEGSTTDRLVKEGFYKYQQ